MQTDDRRLDVKISNGWIIDGLATPRWRGDVGIREGRIVALGDLSAWRLTLMLVGAPEKSDVDAANASEPATEPVDTAAVSF